LWLDRLRHHASGSGDEIRREPVADRLGGDLHGLVFRVVGGAPGGETLLRAGHIVADMRERAVAQYDFAGCNFHELVGCGDSANAIGRDSSDGIEEDRDVGRRYDNIEPMRRRNGAAGAIEIELQGVAQLARGPLFRQPQFRAATGAVAVVGDEMCFMLAA
jgi:hypothetical protein